RGRCRPHRRRALSRAWRVRCRPARHLILGRSVRIYGAPCDLRILRIDMSKALVIVESPAKAKTINKYLGRDYVVKSSVGHIRDLPTGGGGTKATPAQRSERAASAAATRKLSAAQKVKHKEKKAREQLVKRMGVDPDHKWRAQYEILPGK